MSTVSDGRRAPGAEGSPRERLLRAAREVVAEKGLEGLSLRAIARHAGVSHGAPLRHFPTLASLLAALAAEGFDRLVAAIDEAVAEFDAAAAAAGRAPDARRRLARAGDAYVSIALADPGVFSVTFRPELCDVADPEYVRAGTRSFDLLVELVRAAQAEGWHPGLPADELAAVAWANVHGTAELLIHGALAGVLGDRVPRLRPAAHQVLFGDPATGDPARALPAPEAGRHHKEGNP